MKNNQETKVNHTSRETHHQHHTIYKFILLIQYICNKQNQRKTPESQQDASGCPQMGDDPKGVSLNWLNNRYKRYTDVKLIHTRSLFGAKRAFRNNTVLRKTSFDPDNSSYPKNKSLLKKTPYETITLSNHYIYSKPQSKIEHSIKPEGFRTLILNFTSGISKGLCTSKNCDTDSIRIWISDQCTLAILLEGL